MHLIFEKYNIISSRDNSVWEIYIHVAVFHAFQQKLNYIQRTVFKTDMECAETSNLRAFLRPSGKRQRNVMKKDSHNSLGICTDICEYYVRSGRIKR